MATISNSTSNTIIVGTSYNDSIENRGNSVTLDAAAGDDSIGNYGSKVSIKGAVGNDSIRNYGALVTIEGSDGNDYIDNIEYTKRNEETGKWETLSSPDNTTINGGNGNDSIFNVDGSNVMINGGAGNDSIENGGSNVTIDAAAGDDIITNSENSNVTIDGGSGNDTIDNYGSEVSINGGAGDDSIHNGDGSDVTINTGAGDDSISNYGNEKITINSGADNDSITIKDSSNILINADTGNDSIYSEGVSNATINGDAGNDTIRSEGISDVSINAGEGNDYIEGYGENITVDAGNGDNFIEISGDNILINGGAGKDSIISSVSNASINGGAGNDSIISSGYNASINGGAGNDSIIGGGYNTSIDGGDGNDIIRNYKIDEDNNLTDSFDLSNVLINGGNGDDLIEIIGGENTTINGGKGNDTISLNTYGTLIQYAEGDGNDVIEGFNEGNTLQIGDGSGTYSTVVSGSDIIVTVGDSKITLKGVAGLYELPQILGTDKTPASSSQLVQGTSKNDNIGNAVSDVTIDGGAGDDTISTARWTSNVSINGNAGNDLIINYGSNVTIEGGTGNDSISNYGSEVTINGGKDNDTISIEDESYDNLIQYTEGDGNDVIEGFNYNSTLQIGDGSGTYSTVVSGSDVIVTVGNGKITLKGLATWSQLPQILGTDKTPASSSQLIQGTSGNDNIGNADSDVTIDGGAGNDTISTAGWTNNVSINGNAGNDSIISYGSNVTIDGGDGSDYIEVSGDGESSINGGAGNDTIISESYNSTIDGGDGSDYISNEKSDTVSINGGVGDDSIYNGYYDDYEYHSGGSNVTINGGKGNDYIYLNFYGENLIQYSEGDGNDTIVRFDESDTLQIGDGSGTYSSFTNGNDVIITVGESKIILKGAGYNELKINGTENPKGTDDDDAIDNTLQGAVVEGFGGNDTLRNGYTYRYGELMSGGSDVSIDGGAGDDSISNYGAEAQNVTINGGAGNDSITNVDASNVTIDGGDGNDLIRNGYYVGKNDEWYGGSNVSINGGDGDDSISNYSDYYGEKVTIDGGVGNDSIENDSSNAIINGGADNDTITDKGDKNVIDGGDGSDYIEVGNSESSINGGVGNDTIISESYNSTIDGGEGSDYIEVSYDGENSINGGAGNDTIVSSGRNTISGSIGNDHISLKGSGNLIRYTLGDGNDTIWGFGEEDTLKISGGYYASTAKSGSDIIVTVGDNKITLVGAANLPNLNIRDGEVINNSLEGASVDGTRGGDEITNSGDSVTINANAGNNSIYNSAANVLINGGVNKDYITNSKENTTINGDAGDDYINNSGLEIHLLEEEQIELVRPDNSLIDAGAGNDTIYNTGSSVEINGGDGDDSIFNNNIANDVLITGYSQGWDKNKLQNTVDTIVKSNGQKVTITGGAGNDHISLSSGSENTLIKYASGDGNDTVLGFDEDDTLSISDDAYSTMTSGNDVIVKVGKSSITLKDAKNKTLNIDGEELEYEPVWTFKNSTATCEAADKTKITVKGVKSADGLTLSGDTIIVSAASLGTQKVTVNNGYTLVLDDDVKEATFDDAKWTLKNTTATLSQKQSAGYICDGNAITYSRETTTTLATLTGVNSLDGLSVDGNVITLPEDALGSATVKLTKGDYKLTLDDNVVTEPTTEPTWFISGTKATYKDGNSAYYSIASNGKSVNFVKAAADKKAKDLITLNGINKNFSADDVEIDQDNQIVTLSNNALNKKNVTIGGSEDYSLALGDDVKEAEVDDAKWSLKKNTATLSQKQSVGYVCNGGSITYSSKATTATLATLTGVQSVDGLSVDGNVIKLSEDALGSANVKLTKGNYKLELDDDVATEPTSEPTWFISGTKATYKDGNSAYYSLASNGKSVNFVKAAADKKAKDLITLSGVNKNFSADDIEIDEDNQIVTLSNNALNKKTVTIGGSEDYSLALGDDVKKATVSEPRWAIKKNTATLSQKQSVGYVCNGGSITYSSKSATVTLATLTGVQSVDGISVDGNVITLSEDALGSANVKLTKGNYKLELDDSVATKPTTEPTWFISGIKATYKDGNSAYYSMASNGKSVNFVKAAADKKAKDLITLSGVNKNFSADDIEIDEDNKVITLSANALDKKNVTIGGSEDYSLALGDDVIKPELGDPKLEVKGSKATLTQSTSIGYVLTNDKTITYSKKVSATTLATVSGVKGKSGISFDESSITLSNSALTNKVTVSGDVSFEFKANYKNASITGSKDDDVISVLGTGVSVTGGKGDDYFTSGGGGNIFIYASGDGDDVIADFTSNDRIKVTSGDFKVDTDGNDVIVSVTKGKVTGSITLSNAAGQSITIIDSKNKGHFNSTSASDYWFDENSFDTDTQISSLANFTETNNQIGGLANFNEMNNTIGSFNTFSNKDNCFTTYNDKK